VLKKRRAELLHSLAADGDGAAVAGPGTKRRRRSPAVPLVLSGVFHGVLVLAMAAIVWRTAVAPGLGSAALCILVSMFAWRFLRESRMLTPTSERSPVAKRTGMEAIRSVMSHPKEPASRLIWIYAIAIGAFYGTTPMLPLILADRLGINETNVGYFVMYLGGIGVIVRAGILGRMISWLGEVRLARLGILFLAAGLVSVARIYSYPTMLIAFTLMPVGTAFLFPCVTAMLSRAVSQRERGLYMGVQHTFGGISRVAFPLMAGYGMDVLGKGMPFLLAGALTLLCLILTTAMEDYAQPPIAASPPAAA
jgi:nitrate/nitrite transporter NarK